MAPAGSVEYAARVTNATGAMPTSNLPTAASLPPIPGVDSDPALQSARILIIDDEMPNVRLLERILERARFQNVRSTTDSREVERIFQEFQPDLVLTDWVMPHVDGAAVIGQIRELIGSDDYLPVVVLTADVTQQTKERALRAGATDFLTKPFEHLEVLLRIGNLLQARSAHLQIQEQNAALEESVRLRTGELERALEELKGTQKQVIQQERLAALGAMAGGIAHDFNNSLCAIVGFSELLLHEAEHGLTKEAATPPLTNILTAAEDASQIVHRLAEFYRPSETDERRLPINLNTLVEQAITLTAPRWQVQSIAAGREVLIETDLREIPTIAGSSGEIREVLTNLIFNAVDAMPDGGTITFATRAEDGAVLLQISDTGTGMTEEVRTRCLEPFFTTKGESGTGLGLAMVFGIVQRHGGTIALESTLGLGTSFAFRFPTAQSQSAREVSAAEETIERTLHVLVVDDQPILRQLLCDYLENDLHTAEAAATGEEALEKFHGGAFDLVITDQIMAEMNGYELAAELKALKPDVPVILLTGFVDSESEPEPGEGVDLVVGKPISRAALRSALARVCPT
ncbi:MAG: response regulator [Chthoniobacterales bacterium]